METTKERAARCDRATHARRSSSLPAYGSRTASITRRRRRAKRKALRAATLAAAVLLLGGISVAIFTTPAGSKQETNILPPTTTVGAYIPDTPAPAAETVEPTEPAVRYTLTDAERDVVERVVMAEAGGESFEGQMLVAQCILNAAEKRGVDPSEAVVLYSYTKSRPDPTQRVKDAVAAVFDRGETIVDEPILYFYNPALVTSASTRARSSSSRKAGTVSLQKGVPDETPHRNEAGRDPAPPQRPRPRARERHPCHLRRDAHLQRHRKKGAQQ